MKRFLRELRARQPLDRERRWLFVPYDQLSSEIGPLVREDPEELGILLLENRWQARRRPHHRQKLALWWANQRHFALEQADRGVAVRYETVEGPFAEALRPLLKELGPMRVMDPAERELRRDLTELTGEGLEVIPHEGWLTTQAQFRNALPAPPWRPSAQIARHSCGSRRTCLTLFEESAVAYQMLSASSTRATCIARTRGVPSSTVARHVSGCVRTNSLASFMASSWSESRPMLV